ncbi:MAG: hypothetical protein ACYC6L_03535 [Anaerolineae bacterium]
MAVKSKTSVRGLVLRVLLVLVIILLGVQLRLPAARADGVVHMYYFYDPNCTSCAAVQKEVLDPLVKQYGSSLAVDMRDMNDQANFELLLALESKYGIKSGGIPEVFIGDYVLAGEAEIRAALAERIAGYLASGVALPQVTAAQPTAEPTALPTTAPASGGGLVTAKVNILLFYSPTCPHCHDVMTNVLPPLQIKYGADLQVRIVNVSEEPGNSFWLQFMSLAGIADDSHYVPMLVNGSQIMIGADTPKQSLDGLIAEYMAKPEGAPYAVADMLNDTLAPIFPPPAGAVTASATPAPTATSAPANPGAAINAAYFYQDGCDVCERADRDLKYMQQKYPQLVIRRISINEGAALNQYLSERAGVPETQRLTAPALFIGDKYLLGDNIRAAGIETMLQPYLANGAPEPWAGFDENASTAEQSIVERFRSFGIFAVIGAGLLDGINPCAFATIIFLLSYLAVRKKTGKVLLLTGGAFTLGVFLTYLGVGFGLLKALAALPFLNVISKWLYGATAIICVILAFGSVSDYFKARDGKLEDMSLTLPKRLRGVTHRMIRKSTVSKWVVLSALGLGLVVSLIELACTGQVYLPTIVFVLGVPELRARAALTLILYNLMFIIPLVVVFMLVYFGTTSQDLTAWMKKHAAAVKLVMAVFFVLLAAWLIYSIVA